MKTVSIILPDQLYDRLCESYRIQGITDTDTAIRISICDFLYQSVDTDDSKELADWTILNSEQGAMLLQKAVKSKTPHSYGEARK